MSWVCGCRFGVVGCGETCAGFGLEVCVFWCCGSVGCWCLICGSCLWFVSAQVLVDDGWVSDVFLFGLFGCLVGL